MPILRKPCRRRPAPSSGRSRPASRSPRTSRATRRLRPLGPSSTSRPAARAGRSRGAAAGRQRRGRGDRRHRSGGLHPQQRQPHDAASSRRAIAAIAGRLAAARHRREDRGTRRRARDARRRTRASAARRRAPAAPQAAPRGNEVAVAQRAVLYVEPSDPSQQPRPVIGRVSWRVEAQNAGQGQPLETVLRADIDIPEAGLAMVFTIRKNNDSAFPASHILGMRFARSTDDGNGACARRACRSSRPRKASAERRSRPSPARWARTCSFLRAVAGAGRARPQHGADAHAQLGRHPGAVRLGPTRDHRLREGDLGRAAPGRGFPRLAVG